MTAFLRLLPVPLLFLVLASPILGADAVRPWAGLALAGWLAVAFAATRTVERVFLAAAAASAAFVALALPGAGATLALAFDRALVFVAIMHALGLLRDAARSSRAVRDCGAWLIAQPPAWRFAAIAAGGHAFGIALNMGAVTLLGTLVNRANTLDAAGGDSRVVAIRRERMNVALLQGFFIMLVWSPMAISIAFTLAMIPGLTWFDIAPPALAFTVVFLAMAWAIDRLKWPPNRRLSPAIPRASPPARQALPMGGLILALVALTLGLKSLFAYPMLEAIATVAFAFALPWLYVQYRRRTANAGAATLRRVRAHLRRRLPEARPEAIVLAAASFLGVTLGALARQAGLSDLLDALAPPAWLLAIGVAAFVIGGSQLGIVALVTSGIAGGAVLGMANSPLAPLGLALSLQIGWTISSVLSAYSGGTMLLSRIVGVSPSVFRRWNLPWAASCFALFALAAYVFF
ncbi:MAG: hypothetical protein ACKO1J_10605 [Tagaea sp.]